MRSARHEPEAEAFRRRVSPSEWLYLAVERQNFPFVIQLVVEGQGTLAFDTLRHAVERAAAASPGARLRLGGRSWVDSGHSPVTRQVRDLQAELDAPLDPYAGRGCEVLLAPGPAVCFRTHHAVMDGRGLLVWAFDVFRALRGEEPLGGAAPVDDMSLLRELGTSRRPFQRARWPAPLPFSGRDTQRGGTHWSRRALDGVHPALVAKVAAAVTDIAGAPSRVMVPVDLRRHRPELRSHANLTLPVFLSGGVGQPWQEWHEQLLQALAARRELAAGEERVLARLPRGLLGTLVRAVGSAGRVRNRYPCTALVSHLGRVDPDQVRAPDFEPGTVYSLPVRAPLVPVSFTSVEFGNHTQLVMSAGAGLAGPEAEALLDAVCEDLSPRAPRLPAAADPAPPAAPATTLTALLRRQVRRTPEATALVGPDGEMSYRTLDEESDAVAELLVAHGVAPGSVVGLPARRTPATVAALWGVLKAGAAYLPLDPRQPPARTASVLADAGAVLRLVTSGQEEPAEGDCPVVVLGAQPAARQAVDRAVPEGVAYVLHTSGSTGAPKGVQIEHRALVEYVRWATEHYGVDTDTRFALFTSLAFDLSGTALFLPLLAGGSVALIPGEPDHYTLRDLLTRFGANALKATPAHLDLITSLGVTPVGYRTVVVGGEQLRGGAALRAQRLFGPDCRIFNEYGPTEATIGCIVHTFDAERDGERAAVPIGLPAGRTGVRLLDVHGRPVRPGEAGEIHLTGGQLARGYLGRPDLDREHFVRLADGTRAYRTGDLARLDDRGTLEYLGRSDHQLSVRGHRIEPSEVESALERHPQVARALVTARPGATGEPLLCAYVTGSTAYLDEEELRGHVAELLPAYLVPAVVRSVRSFPLDANGKIDAKALPAPYGTDPVPASGNGTEADPLHTAVAAIWSRCLGVAPLSIAPTDTFPQLGGDSLTLLLMMSEVARDLVAEHGQRAFHAHLADRLSEVTPERICAAVTSANSGSPW